MSLHIILTGATGYIGSRLLERLLNAGHRVTALARRPPSAAENPNLRWFPWSIGEPPPADAFLSDAEPTAVIHLAHHWQRAGEVENPNHAATLALLQTAREHGVRRFVFASSASARADALNAYGRVKWGIETLLHGPDEVAARIGLVYGGPRAGLWGTLCRIVALSPVLPMVGAGVLNQPIHIDDICDGLERLATLPVLDRSAYVLADPNSVPFGAFLQLIAGQTLGKKLVIIPISFTLVMGVLDLLEKIPKIPSFNRERLLGLAGIRTHASAADLEALGLKLRPLAEGLAGERQGRVRLLLREGLVLLRYLGGARPTEGTLRRYVRGVCAWSDGTPTSIPAPARMMPVLLALWEPVKAGGPLSERLALALRLVETTPAGAARMYNYQGDQRVKRMAVLVLVLIREAVLLPVRLVLGRRR